MLTPNELDVIVRKYPVWRATKQIVVQMGGYTFQARPGELLTDIANIRRLLEFGEEGLIVPLSASGVTHRCSACGHIDFLEVKHETASVAASPSVPAVAANTSAGAVRK